MLRSAMSSKRLGNRLASLNGLMLALAIVGLFLFLTSVTPTARLSYVGVLGGGGVVILLLGFLLFVQPQE